MKLEHAAIWAQDLERLKEYYVKHFGGRNNRLYRNPITGFSSYFLEFQGHARLEIMHRKDVPINLNDTEYFQYHGLIHLAFAVSSTRDVDGKAEELKAAGYKILRGPRTTGDGYYEFETMDPEGNRIEVIYDISNRQSE